MATTEYMTTQTYSATIGGVVYNVTANLGTLPGQLGWYNVTTYGAVGDGVTDDTGAIQDANDGAAGGVVYFPPGTYILDAITGAEGHWLLSAGATLKHKSGADAAPPTGTDYDYMIRAENDFTLSGGTLDGNSANQTNRTSMIGFYGDNLHVYGCTIKNTVQEGFRIHKAITVNIHNNNFYDIGEHGASLNEDAMAIHVHNNNAVTPITRAVICENTFINGAPTTDDVAPVAIAFSSSDGMTSDVSICGNIVIGFGTIFSGNPQGAIEIYQNCSRAVIANNTIYDAYNCGIRIADSSDVIVANNVSYIAAAASTVPFAISVTAQGHRPTTHKNLQIIGNTVSNAAGTGGIYLAGGGASNLLDGGSVSDNIVIASAGKGIQFEYCGGNIVAGNNIVKNCGTYGYFIKSSEGSMLISGGVVDSPTSAGVYCRDSVTDLLLTIDGLTVSNSGDLGISARSTSANIINCIDIGSSRILDSEHTLGRVEGCSWQRVYNALPSGGTMDKDQQGATFTNAGATGATTVVLPSVATLPVGAAVRVVVLVAQAVYIDPNASDRIFPTCAADGYRLTNSGEIGASVTLEYTHADGWSIIASSGTWTDAGS